MVKKILVLAAGLVVAMAGPALAGDGYADEDSATVSDTTVEPGQPVTVSAGTFCAGCPVTFTLFSAPVALGTVDANANGVATLTFTVPENTTPGTHTIEASGTGADGQPLTVTTTITVLGAAGAGNLPTTGNDGTAPMTKVALAAIAGGGLLVILANRRHSAKHAARETAGV